jgi:hypothetical protein
MTRKSFLILSSFVLLFASCKQGGKSGLLVPEDAAVVVHINSSSLASKLSWEEIRQTNWFKEIAKKTTDTTAQQLLTDPASSGIDTKADLVFYMKKQGRGSYLIFTGSLTDATAFETLAKKINKGGQVSKDGDFNTMPAEHGNGTVVWNKSRFAYTANAPLPDMKGMMGPRPHSDNDKSGFPQDSLKIFGIGALTLKSSDNLDNDKRFASLVKDGSDVHLWMNISQFYTGMGAMMSMMKMDVLLENNVSASSLNFDNGRITVKSKQYYGKEMSELLDEYKPENVKADVINRIPSQNVVGVFAFNYPPKGVKEFLKITGLDGVVNMFLARANYSIDEFIKANKGEVLLAFSDVNIVTKQDTMDMGPEGKPYIHPSTKPDVKVLFATSVNDKAAFEKLITLLWESSKGASKNMSDISYKLENNWFAASNSAEQTDKFLAGGNNKISFADKISGHPFGGYVDLQKIIGTMGTAFKDSSEKEALDASLKMWQDIVATGGDYKDKALQFEFEINLVDKSTNSLKQLNQYFDKLAAMKAERRKRYEMPAVSIEDIEEPAAPK